MTNNRTSLTVRASLNSNNKRRRTYFVLAVVLSALTVGAAVASASSGGLGRFLRASYWSSFAGSSSNAATPQRKVAAQAPATMNAQMVSGRTGHTATTLKDGRIVIAGGRDSNGQVLSSLEIFDPLTNASTSFASLMQARESHTASLLADGRVFIAGGSTGEQSLRSTEIFDPTSGIATASGEMSVARSGHSANAVHNGAFVLIIGGDGSGEVFNARTGSFSGRSIKSGSPSTFSASSSLSTQAAETSGGATIWTDREDYPPYSVVVISGSGFTPGETVNMIVEQILPLQATYEPWTTVADEQGNISTTWFVFSEEFVGATLQATATGQVSGQSASTTFTDALGAGVAPTGDTNGFNIEGGIRAITTASPSPTALRTDWLNNSAVGGSNGVLNENGSPKVSVSAPTYLANDLFGGGSGDDAFSSSSKADDDPNTYTWDTSGSSQGKTDLNRVYVHISKDTNNHAWVTASADRRTTSGASYVDFELNQAPVVRNANGTFTSSGPHNGRTANDLLITAEYSGSGTPELKLFKWELVGISHAWVDRSADPSIQGKAFAASNSVTLNLPYTSFGLNTYTAGQFVEMSVDVSALVAAGAPCAGIGISSVWIRTKTSPSTSAGLVDFAAPIPVSFTAGFTATSVASPNAYPGTITTTATGGSGSGYTYSLTSASATSPGTFGSSNIFSNLTPGDYKVWVKDSATCQTTSNTVTIGKANPSINATGGTFPYDGAQHAGSGTATGALAENLTPITLSYSGTGSTVYGPTSTAPTNAGTYTATASYAGDSNYNLATSAPAALTINQVAVTATAGGYSGVYDGNTHALSGCVVTGFAGLSCTNNPTGPVGPGVGGAPVTPDVSSISTTNFIVTPVDGAWSITPATANCTVTPYDVPYDGNPHNATGACTGVGGADISSGLTINSTHTDAGTYNGDSWSFTLANYTSIPSTSITDKISQVAVTATAGGYSGVYDGNTHALSGCVVTGFAGLSCTNNPTGPVGPGVGGAPVTPDVSSISTTNFIVTPVDGAWSITPATANCTVTPYDVPYDGNPHNATGACTGVGGADISSGLTINSTHTDAGTYSGDSWSFTLANYTSIPSTSITDKISQVAVTATAGGYSGVYDGNTHALSGCVVTGFAGLSCTNNPTGPVGPGVGGAPVTPDVSSISTTNFIVTPVDGAWSITPATANCTVTPYDVPYDGNPHNATGACTGVGGADISSGLTINSTHTDAGTYSGDSWSFTLANYTSIPSTSITDKISQVAVTATAGGYSGVYDGNTHALSGCVVTGFAGLSCTNNPTGPVGPGVGGAPVTPDVSSISTTNFIVTPVDGAWSITPATANCTVTPYDVPYDGNPHNATGACTGVGGADISSGLTINSTHTDAGTYSGDSWSFTLANYTSIPSTSITDKISQVAVTATAGGYSGVYDGNTHALSGCVVTGFAGLSCTNNPTGPVGPGVGGAPVTPDVSSISTTNFIVTPVDGAWSITPAGSTTTVVCPASVTYNGSAQTPCTASWSSTGTDGEGAALTPSYSNNTNFGTANASATFAGDANHTGSSDNKNFSINKAPVTATAGGGSNVYDGAAHSPSGCVVTGTYKGDLACTNTPASVGPNVSTTTISPNVSGTGLSNFEITPVNGSYIISQASTAITFNGPSSNETFACGAAGTYTATLKDTSNNVGLNGVPLILTIGGQTATATTANNGLIDGVATFTLVLTQAPGSPGETVGLNAAWSDGNRIAPAAQSGPFTVLPDSNVGPTPNASTLYTGSRFFWTTGPSSSTATLTLTATVRDTSELCPGDITKANVSFFIGTAQGGPWTKVSNAQNLPVGLVNPNDSTTGTASVISQYNLGKDRSVQLWVKITVGGYYTETGDEFNVPVTVATPGQINTMLAGGSLSNDGITNITGIGNGFLANGYLGAGNGVTSGGVLAGSVDFGGQVTYNKSLTNPQGQLNLYIHSYNKPDGTQDGNLHTYYVKSNSISEMTLKGQTASFGSKTNVYEVVGTSKNGVDGGGVMQFTSTPAGAQITLTTGTGGTGQPKTYTCPTLLPDGSANTGCMSVIVYKSSSGGVWFSSAWGTLGSVPQTVPKTNKPGSGGTYVNGTGSSYVARVSTTVITNRTSSTEPSPETATDQSSASPLGGVFVGDFSNSRTSEVSAASLVNPAGKNVEARRSFVGRAQLDNDGSDSAKFFGADGSLGRNWISSLFDSSVQYVSSSTDPEGVITITVRSCNRPDGSLDRRCVASKPSTHHVYLIETDALSGASLMNGGTAFASKTSVYEVMSNGTKVTLDKESSLQIVFVAKNQMIPLDAGAAGGTTCMGDSGCVAIAAQKSAGGLWYSGAWGLASGF